MEKRGILGLKRPKNMVLIGNKAMGGGGALVKASKEKWGKWGKPNQSTLAPQFLPPPPPITRHFPPFPPGFPLISPHNTPFSPISPHFPWCRAHYGYIAGYITTHLVRVFLRPDPWPTPPSPRDLDEVTAPSRADRGHQSRRTMHVAWGFRSSEPLFQTPPPPPGRPAYAEPLCP